MHDNIINILQAIHKTIGTVRTDNTDGNWNKLLGCQQACEQAIRELRKMDAQESADKSADESEAGETA